MANDSGNGGGFDLPDKHVTIRSDSPDVRVRALPGESAPTVVSGFGSIESVSRPGRRSLTRWTGSEPLVLSVPILLDAFRDGTNVEQEITDLERLAGVSGAGRPARVKLSGTGELIPWAGAHEFYITGIDYGEELLSASGRRQRAFLTLTVTACVDAETEKSLGKKNGDGKKHPRSYRVKAGDTLRSISRKVLGTPDRWAEIRRLNDISDPRIVGKPGHRKGNTGTVLSMPK
jgi:LysM domain